MAKTLGNTLKIASLSALVLLGAAGILRECGQSYSLHNRLEKSFKKFEKSGRKPLSAVYDSDSNLLSGAYACEIDYKGKTIGVRINKNTEDSSDLFNLEYYINETEVMLIPFRFGRQPNVCIGINNHVIGTDEETRREARILGKEIAKKIEELCPLPQELTFQEYVDKFDKPSKLDVKSMTPETRKTAEKIVKRDINNFYGK